MSLSNSACEETRLFAPSLSPPCCTWWRHLTASMQLDTQNSQSLWHLLSSPCHPSILIKCTFFFQFWISNSSGMNLLHFLLSAIASPCPLFSGPFNDLLGYLLRSSLPGIPPTSLQQERNTPPPTPPWSSQRSSEQLISLGEQLSVTAYLDQVTLTTPSPAHPKLPGSLQGTRVPLDLGVPSGSPFGLVSPLYILCFIPRSSCSPISQLVVAQLDSLMSSGGWCLAHP